MSLSNLVKLNQRVEKSKRRRSAINQRVKISKPPFLDIRYWNWKTRTSNLLIILDITKTRKGITISQSSSFVGNDLITEPLTDESIGQFFWIQILKVTVMKYKKRIRNAVSPVIASMYFHRLISMCCQQYIWNILNSLKR